MVVRVGTIRRGVSRRRSRASVTRSAPIHAQSGERAEPKPSPPAAAARAKNYRLAEPLFFSCRSGSGLRLFCMVILSAAYAGCFGCLVCAWLPAFARADSLTLLFYIRRPSRTWIASEGFQVKHWLFGETLEWHWHAPVPQYDDQPRAP